MQAAPGVAGGAALRVQFRQELAELEGHVAGMATLARRSLERAVDAFVRDDASLFAEVIAGDDEIDRHFLTVEDGVVGLMARQAPMAGDLRLLLALFQTSLHLERLGDMAVNVAEAAAQASRLPRVAPPLRRIQQMGAMAVRMLDGAMAALTTRDAELAEQVASLDDRVDELDRGMAADLLAAAGDERLLEWLLRVQLVSRHLERAGDHAVDIAEQAWFLVTGEFREFS